MKYIASSIFFFSGIYLLQFLWTQSFELRFFPKGETGTISDINAIWIFVPFILSSILLVMAIKEDRSTPRHGEVEGDES